MPFTDVKEDAWYYEAVLYAMQEGYFKGVTATTFAPESKLSRAMAVTVLYRMAGEPEVTGTVTFTDVKGRRLLLPGAGVGCGERNYNRHGRHPVCPPTQM